MTMFDRLVDVTSQLGMHYDSYKESEKEKNRFRDEFFKLATDSCRASSRAEKLVEVSTPDEKEMKKRIEREFPGWYVSDYRHADAEESLDVIIEEDPALMKFTFVNPGDQRVYTRQITSGDTLLDEETLADKRPDLAKKLLYKLPWGDVITRPLNTLDSETLAELAEFIYEGRPKVKLAAPRAATEEELAAVDG